MAEGSEVTGTESSTTSTIQSSATPIVGIFDGMKLSDPKAADPQAKPNLDTDPVKGSVQTTEKTTEVVKPTPDEFTRPLMGRYKNYVEAEEAFKRSQDEGLRLSKESREYKNKLADFEEKSQDRIKELEASLEEAKNRPAFQELSSEQLKALWTEDPARAAEYLTEKKFREREAVQSKVQREQLARQSAEEKSRIQNHIIQEIETMESDPEKFPNYKETREIQDEINKRCGGQLTGKPWTAQLLNYTALGILDYKSKLAGGKASKESSEKARLKAESDAAVARGSGGSGKQTQTTKQAGEMTDDEFGAALLAAGPKSLFEKR